MIIGAAEIVIIPNSVKIVCSVEEAACDGIIGLTHDSKLRSMSG
jgi:hypothetical protein